jgi:hypothetical protein
MLTTLPIWATYAATAPLVRLRQWTFAADARGMAVIRGTPIPPIQGTPLVDHAGILLPAGWHWAPPIDAEVVRQSLQLASGDIALFDVDGSWQRIAPLDFVHATRSAVRLSAESQRLPISNPNADPHVLP